MNIKSLLISSLITLVSIPTIVIGGSYVSSLIIGKNPEEAIEIVAEQTDILIDRTNNVEINQTNLQGIIDNQNQTINKLQQNIQNLTPTCVSYWECNKWSSCISSIQSRICIDSNNCLEPISKPVENQSCECKPEWECIIWSACDDKKTDELEDDTKTRTCHDTHQCGTLEKKPDEKVYCQTGLPAN